MIAWIVAIALVLFGLGYAGWATWRLFRLYWGGLAKLGESVGEAAERMSSVQAPIIPQRPKETPLETRARIAEERECGRARRLAGTIGRWRGDLSV